MSKNKNTLKIRNKEESSENKSKNVLPLIGIQNKSNKNNNLANNKINKNKNFQNIEQAKIELKGMEPEPSSDLNPIKEESSENNEITRDNYKFIYSRNINNDNKLKINSKTENKINNIEIINELGKNGLKHHKLVPNLYKIIFVFRNEDFYISVKPKSTIKNLRLAISKLINIDIKQISMVYEDKEISTSDDDKTVNIFFNFKKLRSRPIIYIKKKFISNNASTDALSNFLFKKNYNNKVKITNFPSITDIKIPIEENINNFINEFFKKNSSVNLGDNNTNNENNLYKIETGNENEEDQKNNNIYIIGFPSPDLAFDFNRYLNSQKIINPIFKDIKSNIISMNKRSYELKKSKSNSKNNSPKNLRYGIDYNLDENNLTKRNSNFLKLIRKNYLMRKELKREKNNSQIFVNVSGPYLSSFDKERIEEKENRKKWINPEGFISCVGKYSGIQL